MRVLIAKTMGIKGVGAYVPFRGKITSTSTVAGKDDYAATRHGSSKVRRDQGPRNRRCEAEHMLGE